MIVFKKSTEYKKIKVVKVCIVCGTNFEVKRLLDEVTGEEIIFDREKKCCSISCANSVGGSSVRGTKSIKCCKCGKEFIVNKRSRNVLICDECVGKSKEIVCIKKTKEMVGTPADHPFENYYLYVCFDSSNGRKLARLNPIKKDSGLLKKSMLYSRYLMCVKEGRILRRDEHVDHIDENKMNDDISNLQILSQRENAIKNHKFKGMGIKTLKLKCPFCGKIFDKEFRHSHIVRKAEFSACSRSCGNSFRNKLNKEGYTWQNKQAIYGNIVRVYQKHTL